MKHIKYKKKQKTNNENILVSLWRDQLPHVSLFESSCDVSRDRSREICLTVLYIVRFGELHGKNNSHFKRMKARILLTIRFLLNQQKKTVIHEIMHALGQVHEQQRMDRDNHVIMHWDRIRLGKKNLNMEKLPIGSHDRTPYDPSSILQYGLRVSTKLTVYMRYHNVVLIIETYFNVA